MQKPDNKQYTRPESSEKGNMREKSPVQQPFVLRPDEVYSKQYLTEVMNLSKNTFTRWKQRGLKPLNSNTANNLYFGSDLIDLFRSRE